MASREVFSRSWLRGGAYFAKLLPYRTGDPMLSTLLLALACTDDGTVDDTMTGQDTEVEDTGEASNECEPDDVAVPVEGLNGTVTDEAGAAIQCMRVQFCTDVCINADSNGSGEYSVVPAGNGAGACTVQPLTDTYSGYFAAGVPLIYDGERQVNVKLQPITERTNTTNTSVSSGRSSSAYSILLRAEVLRSMTWCGRKKEESELFMLGGFKFL